MCGTQLADSVAPCYWDPSPTAINFGNPKSTSIRIADQIKFEAKEFGGLACCHEGFDCDDPVPGKAYLSTGTSVAQLTGSCVNDGGTTIACNGKCGSPPPFNDSTVYPELICTDKRLADGSPWHSSDPNQPTNPATDGYWYDCSFFANSDTACSLFGNEHPTEGMTANDACCACEGGEEVVSNCVMGWSDYGKCDTTGTECSAFSFTNPQQLRPGTKKRIKNVVVSPSSGSGAPCPTSDFDEESVACSEPCSDCVMTWDYTNLNCDVTNGVCGSVTPGYVTGEMFWTKSVVQIPAVNGGSCPTGSAEDPYETRITICGLVCVDCQLGWAEFGECDITPDTCSSTGSASGTKTRTKNKVIVAAAGGSPCPEGPHLTETVTCSSSCSNCEMGWGDYSACTAAPSTCTNGLATGTKVRAKDQIAVAPVGGSACPSTPHEIETVSCTTACKNCEMGWSNYSECTSDSNLCTVAGEKIGNKTRTKSRVVVSPVGGLPCPQEPYEKESAECAISCTNCELGWGNFSDCLAIPGTCGTGIGTGTQSRRKDQILIPADGGMDCRGAPYETETIACSLGCNDCVLGWGPWSDCIGDGKCVDGKRKAFHSRTKNVIVTAPTNGGAPCPVVFSTATQTCEAENCTMPQTSEVLDVPLIAGSLAGAFVVLVSLLVIIIRIRRQQASESPLFEKNDKFSKERQAANMLKSMTSDLRDFANVPRNVRKGVERSSNDSQNFMGTRVSNPLFTAADPTQRKVKETFELVPKGKNTAVIFYDADAASAILGPKKMAHSRGHEKEMAASTSGGTERMLEPPLGPPSDGKLSPASGAAGYIQVETEEEVMGFNDNTLG